MDRSIIKSVQFGLLSSEDINKLSVVEITAHDVYDKGIPKYGGLSDLRLGTIDRHFKCLTCNGDALTCPGHFGHINLAEPVYNICYVKHVVKILQCICLSCGSLKVENMRKVYKNNSKQFKSIYNSLKSKTKCNICQHIQPKIISEKHDIFIENDDIKSFISAKETLDIFNKLSQSDINIMGLCESNHPRNLIITSIVVPPPHVRPSVMMDTSIKSQDDLTHKLCEIVKTNNLLLKYKKTENSNTETLSNVRDLLQYHITTYIDNGIPGISQATQRTGRPIKAICQRLKSKDGRIRGNLMGKRVNFTARTVITAAPNIDLDELGVPWILAKILTIPERVTKFNIKRLQSYVKNGYDPPYGKIGAKVVLQNGLEKDIRFVKNIVLCEGDIVERHLKDGDPVIFNRQPSLHKMSMMGHKIKIHPHQTFMMNVCATTPYNADYDGDEMNVHVPQNEITRAEVTELMMISNCIVSPQSSKPVIGVIQDSLLGSFKLTADDTYISPSFFHDIVCTLNIPLSSTPIPVIFEPSPLFSGKQLFELILPDDFQLINDSITIKNGKLLKGQLCKRTLGTSSSGIIHILWLEYGPVRAQRFISDIQYVINRWLYSYGFSVGAMDIFLDTNTQKQVYDVVNKSKQKVSQLLKINKNYVYENKINQTLNNAMSEAGLLVKSSIPSSNNINTTVTSGSKGSSFNIAQIMGCVGQQNVNGQRLQFGNEDRVLCHFEKNDRGPEACGFVESSYKNGLKPHEFFFHAMGGREGIIDTAVKSVSADTQIVIVENGHPKTVEIGPWIDNHLSNLKSHVKYHGPEDANMELVDLSKHNTNVFVPTCDNIGNMSWALLTNITRHDPSETMYKITTRGGRTVHVVESKTMLVWDESAETFSPKDTTELKIGDKVPVSVCLENTLDTIHYLNLEKHLSKSSFIYGTEFNRAKSMIKKELSDRKKVSAMWWQKNNGTVFTLPYSSSITFRRCLDRSDIDCIEDNFVYPYHAQRSRAKISDTFALTEENGFFIGIYLAEGNCHEISGQICIANNNENILMRVRKWFDDNDITHATYKKVTEVGTSTTLQGYSTLMAIFLHKLLGQGARNKIVPAEFFLAPDNFLKGLIDGYFSGDGCITKNSIESSSASEDLRNGIAQILNRFGIYSKMTTSILKSNSFKTDDMAPSYRLHIRSIFAIKFSETFSLSHEEKCIKLENIRTSDSILKYSHTYHVKNDTILDNIISIKKYDSEQVQKVYDITVPKTKNFGLANGLQIYDTSETGYIQRRLVKAMEDIKIHLDKTVRNSIGDIIQFMYGEDGFDATYLYPDIIDVKDLTEYTWEKSPQDEIDNLSNIIETIGISKRKFRNPLLLNRLAKSSENTSDIDPHFVFSSIHSLCSSWSLCPYSTINESALFFLRYAVYLTFHSKWVCSHMSLSDFEHTLHLLNSRFQRSLVQSGEMVGTVAAQSIGEPVTQLTLNSIDWLDNITYVDENNRSYVKPIGEFIDTLMSYYPTNTIDNTTETEYLDIKELNYKIPSVDEDGKISYKLIEAITRHLPGHDGKLIKIKTRMGKEVTATKSKSFLIREHNKIVEKAGMEIKIGDRLPITANYASNINEQLYLDLCEWLPKTESRSGFVHGCDIFAAINRFWWQGELFETPFSAKKFNFKDFPEHLELNYNFGYFIGAYLAEGTLTETQVIIANNDYKYLEIIKTFAENNHIQCTTHKRFVRLHSTILAKLTKNWCKKYSHLKVVPEWCFNANKQFVKGLLNAYISGDGTVNKNNISISSASKKLLVGISDLLNKFGIVSKLSQHIIIGSKDINTLSIRNYNVVKFGNNIELVIDSKQKLLEKAMNNEWKYTYGKNDVIPGNNIGIYKGDIHRDILRKITLTNENDMKIIDDAINSDVYFDEIVSIEEVEPSNPNNHNKALVYDFTVQDTKNFNITGGLCMRDTFHSAGISAKNVTLGVPRFKELINVAKNIKSPSMKIFLNSPEDSEKYAAIIEMTNLYSIIDSSTVIETHTISCNYIDLFDLSFDNFFKYAIKYSLSMKAMKEKRINILEISLSIMNEYDTICCIPSNCEHFIFILVENDLDLSLESIHMLNSKLKQFKLRGQDGIHKVYVENNILETDGSSLQKILSLDFVDSSLTISNDILQIKDFLGIEAAREVLFLEIQKVIEFDGTFINTRHFDTLVDTMTYKGGIMSITRHGINRSDNGPLMKCSFEETIDVLTDASVFYEKDHLRGVTENITMGKLANMGTGSFDLFYDLSQHNIQNSYSTTNYKPPSISSENEYTNSYFEEIVSSFFG